MRICIASDLILSGKHCITELLLFLYRDKALFRAFCSSLYTAHLWMSYKKASYKKLIVAYNDALRLLLEKPRWTSATELFVSSRIGTLHAELRNLMFKRMCRLNVSENLIVLLCSSPEYSAV